MSVTPAALGLPADGGWVVLELGVAHAFGGPVACPPGTELTFACGLDHGVARVRRRLAWRLSAGGEVVAEDVADVGVLGTRRPVRLVVRVPAPTPRDYELSLRATGAGIDEVAFIWPVTVPGQEVDVGLTCRPEVVRHGDALVARAVNPGPGGWFTGLMFELERRVGDGWVAVDPFDGRDEAWAAVGVTVSPGEALVDELSVPFGTEPGLHRIVHRVSLEMQGIEDAALVGHFRVVDSSGAVATMHVP